MIIENSDAIDTEGTRFNNVFKDKSKVFKSFKGWLSGFSDTKPVTQEQIDEKMVSAQAHYEELKTAWEEFDRVFNLTEVEEEVLPDRI